MGSSTVVRGIAGFQARWRMRRLDVLMRLMERIYRAQGAVRIVDIGGTESYWDLLPRGFLDACNVSVVIVNLPSVNRQSDHGRFRFVEGDGCCLEQFGDGAFDIAHANSVIEHVGAWSRVEMFAAEVKRVARFYYVQTPNYWFPVDPHFLAPFFHWLPLPLRLWLVMHVALGHYPRVSSVGEGMRFLEDARLLDRRMMRALFPEGRLLVERVWGLPKSLIAVNFEV